MTYSPLLRRLVVRNYKSISAADLSLGPLTFLIGPNGAGKSNLLDVLRFVTDSLRYSLDHALRDRGGINEVRRRSSGHPTHFGIRLDFTLRTGQRGHYAFTVSAQPRGGYQVAREECSVSPATHGTSASTSYFKVEGGELKRSTVSSLPVVPKDRLLLVGASGIAQFRPLYDALSSMGFYNLNPDQIRELQPPDPGHLLARDGANLSSVLSTLESINAPAKERIVEYLAKVSTGITGVRSVQIGPKETIEFRQGIKGSRHPWRFLANNMSDGTLRALGVLVALFQASKDGASRVSLVGIEEPETALHPAAAGVLTDALRQASSTTQVLVTSHSPDLLDDKAITDGELLAVVSRDGETLIGSLDEQGRSALHDHLYTAGELLRMNLLRPDEGKSHLDPNQLMLFGPEGGL